MTNEEKAIARALAEYLGMRGGRLATDVGAVVPFLPPHRKNGNELRVHDQVDLRVKGEEYDVEIVVKKRTGYIG